MTDKKISQFDDAVLPLDGTELVPVVQSGQNRKVAASELSSGGPAVLPENYPVKLSDVKVGVPTPDTIPAGASYTYEIDLGDVYDEVLLNNFEWVKKSTAQDIPIARLGLNQFCANSLRYHFCFLVKKEEGKSVRLFHNLSSEKIGSASTPVISVYGATVEDVGAALGFGDGPLDSVLDAVGVFGKKVEITDVWLDANILKIKVTNHEAVGVELNVYTGLRKIYPSNTTFVNAISVFGDECLAVFNREPYYALKVSLDGGDNFSTIKDNNHYPNPYISSTVKVGSDATAYFLALIDYNWNTFIYDSSTDTWTKPASDLWNYGGGTSERALNPYGQKFAPVFSGKNLDWTDDLALLIAYEEYYAMVEKSTDDLQSFSTILDVRDLYDYISPWSGYRTNISYNSYAKVVDADTYFAAFAFYYRNDDEGGIEKHHQCLVKTTDGGLSWDKYLTDHPEFVNSGQRVISISDDGLQILIIAFGYVGAKLDYPYDNGQARFNMSSDGGLTWKYASGSWSLVASTTSQTLSSNYGNATMGYASEALLTTAPTGELIAVLRDAAHMPAIYRSETGDSWSLPQRLSSWLVENAQVPQFPSSRGGDSNGLFVAFGAYGYMDQTTESRLFVGTEIDTFSNWGAWGLKK